MLLLGGGAALVTSALLAFMLVSFFTRTPSEPQTPAPAGISPSPSPSTTSEGVAPADIEEVAPDARRFPVIAKLPYSTRYWSLAEGGPIANNLIPLTAVVYYIPGRSQEAAIDQQRPYIENWLRSIGQQPGTYDLKYQAEEFHTY